MGPDAQMRCEEMGPVGTVVWFTVYAQTDSRALDRTGDSPPGRGTRVDSAPPREGARALWMKELTIRFCAENSLFAAQDGRRKRSLPDCTVRFSCWETGKEEWIQIVK